MLLDGATARVSFGKESTSAYRAAAARLQHVASCMLCVFLCAHTVYAVRISVSLSMTTSVNVYVGLVARLLS